MSEKKNVSLEEIVGLMEEATENVEKVYNSGYTVGHREGFQDGYDGGYDSGQHDGYDDGRRDECKAFWDAFQTPTRKEWTRAFYDASWNDNTFYPKHDIAPKGDASALFRFCGITDLEGRLNECGVVLDTSGVTNLNNAFSQSTLTVIPPLDMSSCTASGALNGTFSGCTSLKTIRKIIISINANASSADAFGNCPELRDVTFEGEIGLSFSFRLSPKLTRASIESIITHLSSNVSGKTLTLSSAAVNAAFPDDWDSYVTENKPAGWQIQLS